MASSGKKAESNAGRLRGSKHIDDHTVMDLIEELEHESDARRAYGRIQQRLNVLRATGADIPETLMRMERALALECTAQSQGR